MEKTIKVSIEKRFPMSAKRWEYVQGFVWALEDDALSSQYVPPTELKKMITKLKKQVNRDFLLGYRL